MIHAQEYTKHLEDCEGENLILYWKTLKKYWLNREMPVNGKTVPKSVYAVTVFQPESESVWTLTKRRWLKGKQGQEELEHH